MDSVKRSAGCLFLLIFLAFCVFLCFTGVVGCGKMKVWGLEFLSWPGLVRIRLVE